MKRFFRYSVMVMMMAGACSTLPAQTDGGAAAIAAREDSEERYRRLNSAVEELQAGQVALQKSIAALKDDFGKLREDISKSGNGKASQEDVQKLAAKIEDVDSRREADSKLVAKQLDGIAKGIKQATQISTPPVPIRNTNETGEEKGLEYVIKANDTYVKIAKIYQENGYKVTAKQIQDANPKITPDKMQVGQKIFIPLPASH